MNLRVQHYPPAAKPVAFFGDGLACLSDARLDYFYRELDFENADHFHVSRDWIAFLSVERPYNARSVNGHLMDSVRDHAVQMAILFVRDFDWLFDLAHNFRTPLKTMGEAYDSLPHSGKKAAQQGPSLVSLCLFLGHSNQSSNSIRSRTAPPHRSATIAGGVFPRASGTSYDATSRRNLAGNAIVVARSLIQRAYSLRSNQVENPNTDTAKALPGIIDGSVYRSSPHVVKHDMRLRYEHPFGMDNWSEENERAH